MSSTLRKFDRSKLKKFKKRTSKKLPARLTNSRVNYTVAKAVSRAIDKVSENKIVPLNKVDEAAPVRIQTLALATTKSFTIGHIPTAWSGVAGITDLAGMTMPLGDGHAQRNGKYVYLQKTRLTMEIDMNTIPDFSVPIEFRVMVFKPRRANTPIGITYNFANSLFLDVNGQPIGHATAGVNGTDLMVQPPNKKAWVIFSDRKFMMTNPQLQQDLQGSGVTTTYAGKYPVHKRLVYNLPYYSKVEVDPTTNRPADLDVNYVVCVYAKGLGKDYLADKYEINIRGSTTYKDN